MTRHVQIMERNKSAIFLQYLEKEQVKKFIFFHADKHESLLKIDTIILSNIVKHSQSFQNGKCAISLQYLKKEFRDEVDFLFAD